MANTLGQIGAVVGMNVRGLRARAALALSTVCTIAVVVAVLLAFLAMSNGFRATVASSGSPGIAVVMREGSESELNSNLAREQVDLLESAPNVARAGEAPLVSGEMYVIVDGISRSNALRANLPLRGIGEQGLALRPGVRIVAGRMFRPGTNEIVVGAGAQREFSNFDLGSEIRFNRASWTVVGVFALDGSVFESELWADVRTVQSLFQRGSSVQTVRLKLADPARLPELVAWVAADPRLKLDVRTEEAYYAAQSSQTSDLIMYLGWPLGIAMAIGALAGALNAMYTSVQSRAREIATLRAMGFGSTATFFGTLAESMVLALAGGVLGALAAWLFFDGISATTLGSSFTQVVFRFQISPAVVWQGALLALAIGFIGGVFPAWRAARVPVAQAFRSL